ncbi:DUF4960 domain-containing protein [Pontibacter qinzhouensis]|nr:DUF4960 domain-containing protein [Pontibacter qinzhouensis]
MQRNFIVNARKISFGLILTMLMAMFSCQEAFDNPDFIVNVPVSIESFKIHEVEGVINQNTGEVQVTLPYGSNISAVTPAITLPEGASITPAVGTADFRRVVEYTVINGNLYKKYRVRAQVLQPILRFAIDGVNGSIDNANRTISLALPAEADLTALQPEIELSAGVTINPASGETVDFSEPVVFTVSAGSTSANYTVTVSKQAAGLTIAYLSTAANRAAISNADEKEAADWLFNKFSDVSFVSFQDVAGGKSLSEYAVIWWHHDAAADLPAMALDARVVNALKAYRAAGGNLFLTTFATRYVEALGIVPQGKGPNNVFGDFLPNGFVERDNSWGISFRGNEGHPIFQGLETFETGKAYLLEKGTFRLNHTAWWFVNEWGGYGDGAGWRQQTGGINLASESWDDHLNGRVGIAEFPGSSTDGNAVIIAFGAYDWFNEPDASGNPSQSNGYKHNIERLTENAIRYLGE